MLGFFFLFEGTTQRYTLMRGFRNFKIFTVGGGVQRLFCLRGGGGDRDRGYEAHFIVIVPRMHL